jgi:molecular chaperone Hsp33
MSFDSVHAFLLESIDVKGTLIRLDRVVQSMVGERNFPPFILKQLTEMLLASIFIMSNLKFEGEINVQFNGEGALSYLLVQCDQDLNVRGMATFDKGVDDISLQAGFLKGQLSITYKPTHQTEHFQTLIPIQSTSIEENLAVYFTQSEQISTTVKLFSTQDKACALIVQLLPSSTSQYQEQFWSYASTMTESITEEELMTLTPEVILHRLFHETDVRLFDEKWVTYRCRCTNAKIKQIIKLLGKEDAMSLLAEQGNIEVSCDFCEKKYLFDPIDVMIMFDDRAIDV